MFIKNVVIIAGSGISKNSGGFDFFFEEDSDEIIKEIVRIIFL